MNRTDELARAREEMKKAKITAPEPYIEETDMTDHSSIPVQPHTHEQQHEPQQHASATSSGAMTVLDFMNLASASKYVDKLWESKGKTVQIKKFTKGDLDKISAPLLKKTMKLDLNTAGQREQQMNLDISMDIFSEMEKIMLEIGLSAYKDNRNQPVITRGYIDDVMTDEDFKDLVALVKEVNPKAMAASVEASKETEEAKK